MNARSIWMWRCGFAGFWCISWAIAGSGCHSGDGSTRANVAGIVTFDGQPVVSGSLRFVPHSDNEAPMSGASIADGAYQLVGAQGPLVGRYRVEIEGMRPTGKKVPSRLPSDLPGQQMIDELEQFIPAKYNKDSELSVEVEMGDNVHDFELKSGK